MTAKNGETGVDKGKTAKKAIGSNGKPHEENSGNVVSQDTITNNFI